MKAGDVSDFLEKIVYQEEALLYKGKKYFFNPIGEESKGRAVLDIARWSLDNQWEEDVLHIEAQTQADCVKKMLSSPIWDGNSFLEAESDMTWTEC